MHHANSTFTTVRTVDCREARTAVSHQSGMTVGEYLTSWLESRRSLRPSTQVAYDVHLQRYLLPWIGHHRLRELTTRDIDRMWTVLLSPPPERRPMSPATTQRVHATLMSALNAAVRQGLIDRNPAAVVDLPRAVRPELTVWNGDELARFLDHVRADRHHCLYLLLALTGMRRGEALGLRWADVDLPAGVVHVRRQLVSVAGRVHFGPPKSARGRRSIAVSTRLVEALKWHACDQRLQRWDAGADWGPDDLVFCNEAGEPLDPPAVSRHFNRLVVGSGLPRIRLHDLRHTSASVGLTSGETLLEVSRRLGHATIGITADVYAHLEPVTAHTAADRFDAYLSKSSTERIGTSRRS